MSKTAILAVRIIGDSKAAVAEFDKFNRKIASMHDSVKSAATKMSIISAGVIAFGKSAIDAASDLEQSVGAVHSVFKDSADQMLQWSNNAATAVGLSKNQYNEFATVIGSQLKNLGIPMAEVGTKTNDLIKLGADLASMYGGTTADAVQALSAVFRGETDPIERYGISIKQSDVNARMAAEGLDQLEGEAKKQAETQTRMKMVMEQAADAIGNFSRETDTVAHKQQVARAEFENAKAAIGEGLLPVVAEITDKFAGLAQWLGQHPQLATAFAFAILFVTGVLWTLSGALRAVELATAAWAGAQWLLNSALLPVIGTIGLIILVIGLVAAAFIWAYNNCAWFRAGVDEAASFAVEKFQEFKDKINEVIVDIARLIQKSGGIGPAISQAAGEAILWFIKMANPVYNLIRAIGALIGKIAGIRFPSPPAWMAKFLSAAPPALTGVPDSGTVFRFYPPDVLTAAYNPLATLFNGFTAHNATPVMNVDNSVHINVDGSGVVDERAVAERIRRVMVSDSRVRGLSVASTGGRASWQ
ncbi:hypothetical protein GP475_09700 [Corynebacterium poyangense]|uniref:Uncharacterized protein n=1 Tax=Corynebacterium poyangense TaxID=2684405 RepID=A0A7H0SQQ8_9CORY|nr:hypothetical protein [Corynebacterium poyangense]QNQ90883.1 hypothetical protein GP475_09700 [Corynebacterium poyangense]